MDTELVAGRYLYQEAAAQCTFEILGSPAVPLVSFFVSGFPYEVTPPKKGCPFLIVWLLG